MSLSPRDKMDCYIELYKLRRAGFDKRRDFEWKLSLGLWAAIAILASKAISVDHEKLAGSINGLGFLAGHVLIFYMYAFSWSKWLHSANEFDKEYFYSYKDALEEYVNSTEPAPVLSPIEMPTKKVLRPLLQPASMTQIVITAVLLIFNVLIFWPLLSWPCKS